MNQLAALTPYMLWSLAAYMVGVVIARFVSAEVGETVKVIAAVLFVLAWLVSFIR